MLAIDSNDDYLVLSLALNQDSNHFGEYSVLYSAKQPIISLELDGTQNKFTIYQESNNLITLDSIDIHRGIDLKDEATNFTII